MDDPYRRIVHSEERQSSCLNSSTKEDVLKYKVQLKFLVTNNEAEYEAILMGLTIVQALGAKNILLKSDS